MNNNNLNEDYCSFEVSKLLKEIGFKVRGNDAYTTNSKGEYLGRVGSVSYTYIEENDYIYKPTHALAIKWIRENFGIHIYTDCSSEAYWYYRLVNCETGKFKSIDDGDDDFKSSEEAVEAALLYTLKNLINDSTRS